MDSENFEGKVLENDSEGSRWGERNFEWEEEEDSEKKFSIADNLLGGEESKAKGLDFGIDDKSDKSLEDSVGWGSSNKEDEEDKGFSYDAIGSGNDLYGASSSEGFGNAYSVGGDSCGGNMYNSCSCKNMYGR